MSKDWIINDATFRKIKDLSTNISDNVIKHFINTVVYVHPNCNTLLKQLSDIYVLVASFNAQKYLQDGEKTWKEIMTKNENDILEKNNYFIVAYMLVAEKDQKNHYIDLFDTIIRKNNLGRVMIEKYETYYQVNLVPQYIIQSSAKYWGKVLGFYFMDNDTGKMSSICKEEIEEFIKDFELDSNDLHWEHLYNLCDNEE